MGLCLGKIHNDIIESQNNEIATLRQELATVKEDLHKYLDALEENNKHIKSLVKEKCHSSVSLYNEVEDENKNIGFIRRSIDRIDYYSREDDHE
jgi:cell shape-determining protein MreC